MGRMTSAIPFATGDGIDDQPAMPASPRSVRSVSIDASTRSAPDRAGRESGSTGPSALDPATVSGLLEHLDAAVLGEVLTAAIADLRNYGGALLAAGDAEETRWSAHALAGVSASVGATELAALAARIEEASALGPHRGAVRQALDRAVDELTAVVARHSPAKRPRA
jgi:HPt (histidine-containing phosphotransfer) domain-containing protein